MANPKRERQKQGRQLRQEYLRQQQRRAARRRLIVAGVLVAAVVIGVSFLFSRGGKKKTNVSSKETTTTAASTSTTAVPAAYGTTPCPPGDGSAPRTTTFKDSFVKCIDPAKKYTATVQTDAGTMTIALAADQSPVTVNNFVALARYHFYDGVVCHRVIKGFVDQCGDPKGDGTGGPGFTIGEEPPASGKYAIGQLAMAKTGAPHSTGSQFFIIVGDQGAGLPPQYSYLGTITAGLDAAKHIEADGADADPAPPKVVHKLVKVTVAES